MSKVLRRRMVDELAKRYQGEKTLVVIGYKGLTANQAVELRADLRKENIRMNIVKNSIAWHTFEGVGLKDLTRYFSEMNAVVTGPDPVVIAKKLMTYREKNKVLEVKAAWVEGRLFTPDQVAVLSKLPSRERILANFIGAFAAPSQAFVSTVNEIIGRFVRTIKAVEEKVAKGP